MDKQKKRTRRGHYFVSDPGLHIDQGLLERHLDDLETQDGPGLSPDEVSRRRERRKDAYITAVLNNQDPNGIY